jgi:hypothetical protein
MRFVTDMVPGVPTGGIADMVRWRNVEQYLAKTVLNGVGTQTKRPEKSQQYLMRMVGINPVSLKQAVKRLIRVKLKDCISQIHSDLLPKARPFWILQNLPTD